MLPTQSQPHDDRAVSASRASPQLQGIRHQAVWASGNSKAPRMRRTVCTADLGFGIHRKMRVENAAQAGAQDAAMEETCSNLGFHRREGAMRPFPIWQDEAGGSAVEF